MILNKLIKKWIVHWFQFIITILIKKLLSGLKFNIKAWKLTFDL